jgi:hypothetical protein
MKGTVVCGLTKVVSSRVCQLVGYISIQPHFTFTRPQRHPKPVPVYQYKTSHGSHSHTSLTQLETRQLQLRTLFEGTHSLRAAVEDLLHSSEAFAIVDLLVAET